MKIKSRKQIRFDALHKQFAATHNDRCPHDKYEHYILDCLVHLGEIYDENQDAIRATIREGISKNASHLAVLQTREAWLNTLGSHFRKALSIQAVAGRDLKRPARIVRTEDEDPFSDEPFK
jgi:hypothetical protein